MNTFGDKTKLLLVDDHAIVRAGFRYLLESDADYEIREVNTAEEACRIYSEYKPDAVIMDLLMPGMGGLQGVRHIHAKDNNAKVLVLSMRDDPVYVSQATKAGAQGYVTKRSAPEELTKAVAVLIKGNKYLSADVAKLKNKSSKTDQEKIDTLSEREFEIFCLLAEGHTVVNISEDLHLSPKTVSNHRTRIMHKLHATNIVELSRMAIR
ncbi:MAG: response regulator transcription factor, partial [Gammaproteobacteria bacterium]|nr:response regulator transcription factor [Gammaproteobacteria bacterium]